MSPLGPSRPLSCPHDSSQSSTSSSAPSLPSCPLSAPHVPLGTPPLFTFPLIPSCPVSAPHGPSRSLMLPDVPSRSLMSPHGPSCSLMSPHGPASARARTTPTARRRNSARGQPESGSRDWAMQRGGAPWNPTQQGGQGRGSRSCSGQPLDDPGAGRGQSSARRLEAVPGRRERGRAMAAVPVTTEGLVEVSLAVLLCSAWPTGC